MKKIFGTAIFVALIILSGLFCNSCEAAKKVVAVTELEYDGWSQLQRQAAVDFQEQMVTALVQSNKFDVAERIQLDKVLKEMALSSTGLISGETAIEFGHLTGADYTVIGNVISANIVGSGSIFGKAKGKVKFHFRFVDNRTGIIKVSEMVEGASTQGIFEGKDKKGNILINQAVNATSQKFLKLINKMTPLNGNVVNVNDSIAYIDIGNDNGIRVGDIFVVYTEGEPLIQPKTGQVLGAEENDIGELKIKEVRNNYSICEIIKRQNRIKRGDLVRMK